jgi:hypothetical protein
MATIDYNAVANLPWSFELDHLLTRPGESGDCTV